MKILGKVSFFIISLPLTFISSRTIFLTSVLLSIKSSSSSTIDSTCVFYAPHAESMMMVDVSFMLLGRPPKTISVVIIIIIMYNTNDVYTGSMKVREWSLRVLGVYNIFAVLGKISVNSYLTEIPMYLLLLLQTSINFQNLQKYWECVFLEFRETETTVILEVPSLKIYSILNSRIFYFESIAFWIFHF